MISLDFLKKADVFKDMKDDRLRTVLAFAQQVEFKKNERIFSQGEDASHVWIIAEGDVELRSEPAGGDDSGKTLPVSFTSSAHAFGWASFVPPYKYRLSGYCASGRCTMIKFQRDDLLRIFESDKSMGFDVMLYLIGVVGRQFAQLQDEIARKRGAEAMSRW